jgi:hypothetical protein
LLLLIFFDDKKLADLLDGELQKTHHQGEAFRPPCEFPRMTHHTSLMMGSLCVMRFATMPGKPLKACSGLGL